MGYNGASSELTILYADGSERKYAEVPREHFYKIFYMDKAKDMLKYWREHIRKKFRMIDFKKPK